MVINHLVDPDCASTRLMLIHVDALMAIPDLMLGPTFSVEREIQTNVCLRIGYINSIYWLIIMFPLFDSHFRLFFPIV